jgi:hypothetical protein
MSPRAITADGAMPATAAAVAACRHAVAVPLPALKAGSVGEHAMCPAAATTADGPGIGGEGGDGGAGPGPGAGGDVVGS